jgi:Flp pilus assembly protein TadD
MRATRTLAIAALLLAWNSFDGTTIGAEPTGKTHKTKPAANGAGAQELTQQGWVHWQKGEMVEAAKLFKEAVELAPNNENAWNGLGWASFRTGDAVEAKKAFQHVVDINPRHPAALNGLGQVYLSQRKYDKAERYLLRAASKAPAAWYGLARLYLLQGKFDKAEKWATKIVNSGQGDPTAQEMLQAAKNKKLSDELRQKIEPQADSSEENETAGDEG